MNKYLSEKFRIISLISMIMVVFLHSYNMTVKFNSGNIIFNNGYNFFVQNFFSHGITRIAVPIFFCISGYLFYLNFCGRIDQFVLKYRKRAKTLLLPYLLWSIWGLFFYFIIQILPQAKNFFTKELIENYSFAKILNTIFLNPIPYQLWFVRDLLVFVILSPLIYFIIKYLRFIALLVLFIIWLGFFEFSFVIFSNESILFFILGAYLALHKNDFILKKRDQKFYWIFTILWILIVFLNTSLAQLNSNQIILLSLLHKISILFGIIAIWSSYDIVMRNKINLNKTIYDISTYSFFIYAFHEPILTIIKKGIFYIAGTKELISMFTYFLGPIITILISILLANFIKRISPKIYGLITGGR